MAHSNAKQKKANARYNKIMYGCLAASHAAFLVFRIGWRWADVGKLLLAGYFLSTLASLWIARSIQRTRDSARVVDIKSGNIGIEYHFDVLCLTILVLLVGSFTDYAWLFFLLIPAYVFYILIRYVLDWVFTPTEAELQAAQDHQNRLARKQQSRQKRSKNYFNRRKQ